MLHIRQLALAVFEVMPKETEIQKIISQLEELDFQLRTEKKYRLFLFDPQQSLSEKQKLIKQMFDNKIPNQALNLISLLVRKNMLTDLNQLISHLKKIRDREFNLVEAKVTSALPLTEEEKGEIQKLISKKFAWARSHCRGPKGEGALFACNKKIILKPEVKPEILAGLIVKAEDNLIDLSLKTQLEKLEETLIK